jgi:hypothetical protein
LASLPSSRIPYIKKNLLRKFASNLETVWQILLNQGNLELPALAGSP